MFLLPSPLSPPLLWPIKHAASPTTCKNATNAQQAKTLVRVSSANRLLGVGVSPDGGWGGRGRGEGGGTSKARPHFGEHQAIPERPHAAAAHVARPQRRPLLRVRHRKQAARQRAAVVDGSQHLRRRRGASHRPRATAPGSAWLQGAPPPGSRRPDLTAAAAGSQGGGLSTPDAVRAASTGQGRLNGSGAPQQVKAPQQVRGASTGASDHGAEGAAARARREAQARRPRAADWLPTP